MEIPFISEELIGKRVKALHDMAVHDVEDASLPPTHVKIGDVGTITRDTDEYWNGRHYWIDLDNGEDLIVHVNQLRKHFEVIA